MKATEKIDALGMKVVADLIQKVRPNTSLVTLYRWRTALLDGRGIKDVNKRALVEATKHTAHPIVWADFSPETDAALGAAA
jgi:hypothetical protein